MLRMCSTARALALWRLTNLAQHRVQTLGKSVKLDGAKCHDDRRQFVAAEHQVNLVGHDVWILSTVGHGRSRTMRPNE